MKNQSRIIAAVLMMAAFVTAQNAHAGAVKQTACSVRIEYSLNNISAAPYTVDYVLTAGVTYKDDQSTATRTKVFSSWLGSDFQGNPVVNIDYTEDVNTFDTIGLNASLTQHGLAIETTSGGNQFFTSTPSSEAHRTNYTITCLKAK